MNVFGFNGTDKREGDTIYADGKQFMTAQIDVLYYPYKVKKARGMR